MLMSNVLRMNIPTKLSSIYNSVFASDSFVGVEIETENLRREDAEGLRSWRSVSEGSISGYELVLRGPLYGSSLFMALDELRPLSQRINEANVFSERTSVHVHIDIRDMTWVQVMNFITLSVMFEPVLFKYVAPHRSGNHFCWSFLDCQGLVTELKAVNRYANSSPEALRSSISNHFSVDSTKYSGINLSSIARYGSLEFRMHEGTMNVNSIIRWINILLSIKNYAMIEGKTPGNILETKQSVGIDSIFTQVLGEYKGVLSYKGADLDVLKGIRIAQDFVYDLVGSPTQSLPSNPRGIFQRFINSINTEHLKARGLEFQS